MKVLLTSLALLATIVIAMAQHPNPHKKDSTIVRRYWETGIDLLPLIGKNNLPATSAFFRWNYKQTQHKGNALRMRVGVDTRVLDIKEIVYDTIQTNDTYAPYLSIGHEFQQNNNRFTRYFALDLSGSYFKNKAFFDPAIPDRKAAYLLDIRMLNIGFSGLIGAKFDFTKSLSVGVESAILLNLRKYSLEGTQGRIGNPWGPLNSNRTEEEITTKINPIHSFLLIYKLNGIHHVKNKK